jgi:RNA polymerase sigma factor (TIGR02999 family)
MSNVTRLIDAAAAGDRKAAAELLPLVYDELRKLAAARLAAEKPGQTLQATALVHEAYLRLEGIREMRLENRRHFYGAAARAMRRILVDYARRRKASKRGGPEAHAVPLDAILEAPVDLRLDFEHVDQALERLAAVAPDKAKVAELRYFAGLSVEETGEVLGISPATVKRHWTFARAWLYRALDGSEPPRPTG